MIRKILKNKQLTALLVLILVVLIGVILFIFRPKGQQVMGVEDKIGSSIEYRKGESTKRLFGGIGKLDTYTVDFLPTLVITDNGNQKWEVTESILNDKDSSFNANIIFKSDNINIVFSAINNNRTLEAGKTCFSVDELVPISDVWVREKMYEVSGQQTGYTFMKRGSYIPSDSADIAKYYEGYVDLQKQLSQTPKEKSIIASCSTASRMNSISLTPKLSKLKDGLVRIFYNKGDSLPNEDEIKKIDNFMKNVTF
jgi:hypothetical protein